MEGGIGAVAQMTKEEPQDMIESIAEEKLIASFGDSDGVLLLQEAMRERPLRQ